MTPQEDARVLMALVDRHLRALRLTLIRPIPMKNGDSPPRWQARIETLRDQLDQELTGE